MKPFRFLCQLAFMRTEILCCRRAGKGIGFTKLYCFDSCEVDGMGRARYFVRNAG